MTTLIAAFAVSLLPTSVPVGPSKLDLTIKGTPLEVFCYKPKSYRGERIIMVFHGTLRNAEEYRDHSVKMAERFGALVVAPKFDAERFPSIRYQRGGIMRPDGSAAPKDEWTYSYIPVLAQEVRRLEGKPKMPYYLVGHSAGGQFLVRLAGFFDSGAERIVAANPGSDLFPTRDMPFGYGFGKLPPELSSDDMIRRYLAQPLTFYLGSADCIPDEYFDDSKEAMAQGAGRYQRGIACYEAGKKLAAERGWPFNWRLVVAGAVGHDHEAMFNHPKSDLAFFGRYVPYRR
jgi:pimeloyl-ACP methyl ester carboxylesterase